MAHSSERLALLVGAIIKKTNESKIKWEKASKKGTYTAAVSDYKLHISNRQKPRTTSIDYIITLYTFSGEKLESFSDTDLEEFSIEGYDGIYAAMGDLYKMAAQQAFGTNKAIDAILSELGD